MPTSSPAEAPKKKEIPKKTEMKELAEGLGRKFSRLFKVLAIMGAVSVPVEACASINLSPLAADVGKTNQDVRERGLACENGIYQARVLRRSNKTQVSLLAEIAVQKFSSCTIQNNLGVWDDPTYQEAQAALMAAQEADKKK